MGPIRGKGAARVAVATAPVEPFAVVAEPAAYPPPVLAPASNGPGLGTAAKVCCAVVVVAAVVGGGQRLLARSPAKPVGITAAPGTPLVAPPPLAVVRPASIGGAPRYTTIQAHAVDKHLAQLMGRENGKSAFYGHDRPEYSFVVVPGLVGTARSSYDELAKAARTRGATAATPRAYPGGLVCGVVSEPSLTFVTCTWSGKASSGSVFAWRSADVAHTAAVTTEARAKIEGH
jgi:hypothetical protein